MGVVDSGELVEELLHVGHGGGAGARAEPTFEGLMESFDFALGLGVAGATVFLGDAQGGE